MSVAAPERKLAAILSADVVGYSRLLAEDEGETVRALTAYREEIDLLVRQHRGRVVDTAGDSLLAEFPTALEAVRTALEVQRVIAARNVDVPDARRMQFRIGVHLGDIRVEGERIYGDGVNVAARLQALAAPGGICISATVREQVQAKLNLACEDLGEQSLKNIPEPLRAYRLGPADSREATSSAIEDLSVAGFSGRPAIAVLPFDNLSGDPEQEYFADGIAEDLITRLSAWRGFPVIARNSSFTYKGRAVDVKRVSRDLGVRYVIEGSVRKVADRVRISAQLIDATTGRHVWAERYDRELRDVFALQDEITESIVGSMHPELLRFERERAARKEPSNLDAWELVQRGMWHFHRSSREDNLRARALFERAAELDPSMSQPFSGLSLSHWLDILYGWSDSPAEASGEMLRTAQRSSALDDQDFEALLALGAAYVFAGENEKAIATVERALQRNPSDARAHAFLAMALARLSRPEDAITSAEKAMRLSPQDPSFWLFLVSMALACFAAGRYEDAVEWAQRSLHRRPDGALAYRFLAASYAHLGRLDEARSALEDGLRLSPNWSLASAQMMAAGADPDFRERLLDGLRRAGLAE